MQNATLSCLHVNWQSKCCKSRAAQLVYVPSRIAECRVVPLHNTAMVQASFYSVNGTPINLHRSTTGPAQRRGRIFSSKMSAEQFDTITDV